MKAVIENFRGISEAHIAISPIALITGKNGAGKTSIARAVAAAVTGKAVPYDKVTKKDCAVMLRSGARMGKVTVSNDGGSTTVEWPKADAQSDGRPPFASAIAAGLTDLFAMKEKDALTYLINLLKADIRQAEFIAELEVAGIAKATAEKIWTTIEAQGWEAAHARAKETGTKHKGSWETITGDKYGNKKAVEWLPAEWDDSISSETAETLQERIAAARRDLEAAIGKNAVSQAERDSLKTQAESAPTLEAQKQQAQSAVNTIETELKGIEDELRACPAPDAKAEYSCPHCEGKIHIKAVSGTQYLLSKSEKVSEVDLQKARADNAALCGRQQNAQQRLADARKKLNALTSDLDAATRAKDKLEQLGDAPSATDATDVQAKREALQLCEKRLKLFEAKRDAKKAAELISDNQIIVDLLDEKGLRRKRLAECLLSFQSSFTDAICQEFAIQPIAMDADLNVSLGKTGYPMLSASERFRVRTVLQLAIARIENADLVIIDDADILDQGGRGRLLQAVRSVGIPAIICMTLNKPDAAPNLAAAGAGVSYWVEGNTCRPVEIANTTAKPNVSASAVPERQDIPPVVPAKGFMKSLQEKRDGAAA